MVKSLFDNELFEELTKGLAGLKTMQDSFWESTQDNYLRSIKAATNYPPYNIKKTGIDKYVIEVGVAGFNKSELEIEIKKNALVIKGSHKTPEGNANDRFLWRGLSGRDFMRAFGLQDGMEIKSADLVNGVLKVYLEALIPESTKKTVPINEPEATAPMAKPELLMEKKAGPRGV